MSYRLEIGGALVFMIALGVAIWAGSRHSRGSELDIRSSTVLTGPSGSKALFDVLTRLGRPAQARQDVVQRFAARRARQDSGRPNVELGTPRVAAAGPDRDAQRDHENERAADLKPVRHAVPASALAPLPRTPRTRPRHTAPLRTDGDTAARRASRASSARSRRAAPRPRTRRGSSTHGSAPPCACPAPARPPGTHGRAPLHSGPERRARPRALDAHARRG